jgi:hypothetical protein
MLARQMQKKNPMVSDDEIDAEDMKGIRVTFTTWTAIGEVMEFNDQELSEIAGPLLKKIFYLIEKYAIPFLEEKTKLRHQISE